MGILSWPAVANRRYKGLSTLLYKYPANVASVLPWIMDVTSFMQKKSSISIDFRKVGGVKAILQLLAVVLLAAVSIAGCGGTPMGSTLPSLAVAETAQQSNFSVIYGFRGGRDGRGPRTIVFDGRTILGVTQDGGGKGCASQSDEFVGCGTLFELVPKASGYQERVLHRFSQGQDGESPYGLVAGGHGRFFGVTELTWPTGCGTVFRVDRSGSGYLFKTIFSFNRVDGCAPGSLPIVDSAGNVYATTQTGGKYGFGTVFKLSPSATGYSETIVYSFRGKGDANDPYGRLVEDSKGNIFGTTMGSNGHNAAGSAFELVKTAHGYSERIIEIFPSHDGVPFDGVAIDSAGALYGTLEANFSCGSVFRLTPTTVPTFTVLHRFTTAEGCEPDGVTLDSRGDIFGTTEVDGATKGCPVGGCGSIFELTPNGSSYAAQILLLFHRRQGIQPVSGVILDGAAAYGTAFVGGRRCALANGAGGCGTVFRVTL